MTYDPYDAAMNAQERTATPRWFGQLFREVWAAALVKGQGKVPFDPQVHKAPVTAIDLELVPLPEHNVQFTLERHIIAESKAWTKVTLPSLKALNTDLRALDHAWVALEMAPTGRTYESNGETKDETSFQLVAVFPNEAACREAYELYYSVEAEEAPAGNGNGNGNGNGHNPEKAVAAQFIGPLWASAKGDVAAMEKLLSGNPLTSKHFTITSPEVAAVIAGMPA